MSEKEKMKDGIDKLKGYSADLERSIGIMQKLLDGMKSHIEFAENFIKKQEELK